MLMLSLILDAFNVKLYKLHCGLVINGLNYQTRLALSKYCKIPSMWCVCVPTYSFEYVNAGESIFKDKAHAKQLDQIKGEYFWGPVSTAGRPVNVLVFACNFW